VAHQIATPQELYDNPVNQFVAGFIGSPPMNFLPAVVAPSGALEGAGFSLRPDARLRAALATGSREVTAGIRPENLRPAGDDLPGDAGSVEGLIELIEPLGSQVMIQIAVGGRLIMAQFERRSELAVGKSIRLSQSLGTLHAFNGADGRSLLAS
jgi:multiple sugar transport system ATP-binding protein